MDNFALWLLRAPLTKIADVSILLFFIIAIVAVILLAIKIIKPKIRRMDSFSGDITEIDLGAKQEGRDAKAQDPIAKHKSLLNHQFFHYMDNLLTPGYLTLSSASKKEANKEAVNLIFLRDCKFKIFKEGIQSFVKELEASNGKNLSELPGAISDIIKNYENLSQSIKIILPDGRVLYGVPSCYLTKFTAWNAGHLQVCLEGINRALSDSMYEDDWFLAMSICLERLTMVFELTLEDAHKTLGQLNGDLEREIEERASFPTRG